MGRFEGESFRLGQGLVFCSLVSLSMCTCRYGNRYDQTIIGIETDDNVTHGSVLWSYEFRDEVVDDVWFPQSDDRISSLVKVRLLTDPFYQIELLAVQPQINDLVDLEHITSVESRNETFGLNIQIGSDLSQCAVMLDFIDINSRPPEFMEPIPELNFEIDTNFDHDTIFNDYMNEYLLIEDKDMSASGVYIFGNNSIFQANFTAPPFTQAPYTWIYEVRLYLNRNFPVLPGVYYTQLVPKDDYLNEGRAINVKLTIRDPLFPRFESLKYFYAPKTVPKEGDIFTLELKACLTHDRCRADVYHFFSEPNEIVELEDDFFRFIIDGDKLAGQETTVSLMAVHKIFGTNTTATLTISIPYLNIPFESVVVNPLAEVSISSNFTMPKLGEGLSYKLVNSSLTIPIDTVLERIDSPDDDENMWKFIRKLNADEFGALQDHKTIVVELQAANSEDGGNIVGTSIVVIPVSLKEDETTTEGTSTEGTSTEGTSTEGTSTETSSTVTEDTTSEISSTLSDDETSTEVNTKPSCACPADADNPDGCISTIVIATIVPVAVILICCSCTGVIYFYRRSRSRGIHYHMHDDISLFSASIYNNKTSLYDGKAEYDLSSQRTFDRSFSEDASVYKGHNQLENVMDYPGYNVSLNTEDENLAIGYRPDTPPPPVSWIDVNDDA